MSNKAIKVISDEPYPNFTIDFKKYGEKISNMITNSHPKFSIGIFGGWGIGKTTLMKLIKSELDENPDNNILTIWFEPWKYEKEKHLGVFPLLRTIELEIRNKEDSRGRKRILKGVKKTITAAMKSLEFNASIDLTTIGSVGTTINMQNVIESLETETHWYNNEKVRYYTHVSDHLKAEIEKFYKSTNFRIVVFIDDLDRCVPDKALDVLESIKIFFDITGMIFVIGMDIDSIHSIVKTKYGSESKIDGLNYIQKIIQFPFHVPQWNREDLKSLIREGIRKELEDSEIANSLYDEWILDLITKSVLRTPRQLKRFINLIILTRSIFDRDEKLEELIVIQALQFNREWNKFLEIISDDIRRENFSKEYSEFMAQLNIEASKKEPEKYSGVMSEVVEYYPNFGKAGDHLTEFLDPQVFAIISNMQSVSELSRYISYAEDQIQIREGPSPGISACRLNTEGIKSLLDKPAMIGAREIKIASIADDVSKTLLHQPKFEFQFIFDKEFDFESIRKYLEDNQFNNIQRWDTSIFFFGGSKRN